MLSITLGFPKGKRVTDPYSVLALEAVGSSQVLLPPWAQRKYWTNDKIVSLVYNVYMGQR